MLFIRCFDIGDSIDPISSEYKIDWLVAWESLNIYHMVADSGFLFRLIDTPHGIVIYNFAKEWLRLNCHFLAHNTEVICRAAPFHY